jgi:hypothetical protein
MVLGLLASLLVLAPAAQAACLLDWDRIDRGARTGAAWSVTQGVVGYTHLKDRDLAGCDPVYHPAATGGAVTMRMIDASGKATAWYIRFGWSWEAGAGGTGSLFMNFEYGRYNAADPGGMTYGSGGILVTHVAPHNGFLDNNGYWPNNNCSFRIFMTGQVSGGYKWRPQWMCDGPVLNPGWLGVNQAAPDDFVIPYGRGIPMGTTYRYGGTTGGMLDWFSGLGKYQSGSWSSWTGNKCYFDDAADWNSAYSLDAAYDVNVVDPPGRTGC